VGNSKRPAGISPEDARYPIIHKDNPYRHINVSGDDVVYLSRWGREMIDGRGFHAHTVIVPLTFDNEKETQFIHRQGNFKVYRLPIDKYIKWKSGGKALPIQHVVNIVYDVCMSGDSWERALSKYVSMRHTTDREDRGHYRQVLYEMKLHRIENDKKVTQMVVEAIHDQA